MKTFIQPCVSMREIYAQRNRLFAHDTKNNIKSLRSQQSQFFKVKSKYEKACKEATVARTALVNAKEIQIECESNSQTWNKSE
eukprot:UN07380